MTDYEKETGMTLQAHKNRVLLKLVIGAVVIGFLLNQLRLQKKGKGLL